MRNEPTLKEAVRRIDRSRLWWLALPVLVLVAWLLYAASAAYVDSVGKAPPAASS